VPRFRHNLPGMIRATRRLTIAGLLIVAACNPANLPNQGAPSPGSPAEETAAEEAAAEAAALQAECEAQFRDLLDELAELDSRLAVGVQFDDYLDLVGDARVAYDAIPFDDLAQDCVVEVGLPAEKALNLYVKASNLWNNCVGNFNCDFDKDLEPKLQERWAEASVKLDDAQEGLDELAEA
jgi:hypothetical protein